MLDEAVGRRNGERGFVTQRREDVASEQHAVAQPAQRSARELELGLEIARESQQHDPRKRRAGEARIARRADDRVVGGRQAHERCALTRVAMDDP